MPINILLKGNGQLSIVFNKVYVIGDIEVRSKSKTRTLMDKHFCG